MYVRLYCGAAEIEEGSKTQVRKEVNGLGLHFLSTIMKRKRQRREKKKGQEKTQT